MENFRYYNHAMLPRTLPHIEPDISCIRDRSIWKRKDAKKAYFVRWTSDFDCGYETDWWYCIKDTKMNLADLKAKRRYEINVGIQNCEVKKINSAECIDALFHCFESAVKSYESSDLLVDKTRFIQSCNEDGKRSDIEYYGAFLRETGELIGYAINIVQEDYVAFSTMKFTPEYLSKKGAAALVYTMVCEYLNKQGKKYINDGERSIRHVTNFQDYLIKYFCFRKAYCKLHVVYKPFIKPIVLILFKVRKILKRWKKYNMMHNLISVLEMEEIHRSFKQEDDSKNKGFS